MDDSIARRKGGAQAHQKPAKSWIACGFEQLYKKLVNKPVDAPDLDYDVVVIGSGYAGAIAAAQLAACKVAGHAIRLCVLERGTEYLPGMFPSRMADLPGHVRVSLPNSNKPVGRREGLFDVRVGADVSAIVANGLGGGSLINAGVMEQPLDSVFDTHWPDALREDAARNDYYRRAKQLLGATNGSNDNSIERHPVQQKQPLKKYQALKQLARGSSGHAGEEPFRAAAITIAMHDKQNSAGVALKQCKLCGDCATGCNHGAKDSLDVNLLHTAWRAGAEIYTGATVLQVRQAKTRDSWSVSVTYTDKKLRKRHDKPPELKARRIILAAGTLGSTEILLRSASDELKFSHLLGRKFSTNGDMLAVAYAQNAEADAVADESQPVDQRQHGPCITGIIDLRRFQPGLLIEELAVPAALRRLFAEVFTTANSLHALGETDKSWHSGGAVSGDPFAVNAAAIQRTSVYAVMGDDGAEGALELDEEPRALDEDTRALVEDRLEQDNDADNEIVDGAVRMRWPNLGHNKLFSKQIETLRALAEHAQAGGRVLANPLWRLLPDSMNFLLENQPGPLLTVHPLGGCPMGNDVHSGVVDSCGQVFNAAARNGEQSVFDGLVVLDGSIVPGALGTNPALTIAALALRAVEHLRVEWQFEQPAKKADIPAITRPVLRAITAEQPAVATEIQVVERLAGEVALTSTSGAPLRRIVELTLRFDAKQLTQLSHLNAAGHLQYPVLRVSSSPDCKQQSVLRIFKPTVWRRLQRLNLSAAQLEAELASCAEFSTPLGGTLTLFNREPSNPVQRCLRALYAWLLNRGLRDTWQWFAETLNAGLKITQNDKGSLWTRLKKRAGDAIALASHAGEVRLLEYDLRTEASSSAAKGYAAQLDSFTAPVAIRGVKRITYARRCNPWRQLSEMTLTRFPGLQADIATPTLKLDTNFLARQGIPLLRLVKQRDQITALADLVSFGAYFVRLLLSTHVWSFRKPDTPAPHEPQRLPARIDGLPPPVVKEIEVDVIHSSKVDDVPAGTPVLVRLTRYPCYTSTQPPLVMLHGYSASGTSFAHPAVQPNLASHMWNAGRDVWIVDLRTSCGLPTARHPWAFEEVALADIPVAIDYIYRKTGNRPLDIIAHCMGSAMFSMAVLSAGDVPSGDRFSRQRQALPARIHKAVLSQVGPAVVFSPANIFGTYLASYLKNFLPLENYTFRTGPAPTLTDQLLDRLLATLPYPEQEFALENPAWPPWRRTAFVNTRHRMDALYGRDFSLANIDRGVLAHIDDLFGPLNIDTVSQAIHFARLKTITNREGRNVFLSQQNLQRHWHFPTLCVHGEDNGLADVATLDRMQDLLSQAGCDVQVQAMPDFGHQDCLLGREAVTVFEKMREFLQQPYDPQGETQSATRDRTRKPLLAVVPASGPVIGSAYTCEHESTAVVPIMVGLSPSLGVPALVVFLQLQEDKDRPDSENAAAVASVVQIIAPSIALEDTSGWLKMTVPAHTLAAGCNMNLLLIYEQMQGLENVAFGDNLLENTGTQQAAVCRPLHVCEPQCSQCVNIKAQKAQLLESIYFALRQDALVGELVSDLTEERLVDALLTTLESCAANLQRTAIQYLHAEPKADRGVCFAFGSCQYPGGILDRAVAYASYQRLADHLDDRTRLQPEFLILAGDQIYVDATADLFDPSIEDGRYVQPYHRLLRNSAVQSVLRRLPSYTMLDDHEIDNNWEGRKDDADLQHARNAYRIFQRGNTPCQKCAAETANDNLFYDFVDHDLPFFMLDTRTDRKPRTAGNLEQALIIDQPQFNKLQRWLHELKTQRPDVPKFVVSPAILLPRHTPLTQSDNSVNALRLDGWDGYPASMQRLLAFIADEEIQNVVFLSGDEHLSCVATGIITKFGSAKRTTIYSMHSSALFAPFPFANSVPEDFFANEEFEFAHSADTPCSYTCNVETEFFPGDGFALLNVTGTDNTWTLRYQFNRAQGAQQSWGEIRMTPT